MKIQVYTLNDEEYLNSDFRSILSILVDGKRVFRAADGESEDASLDRDFNDCWNIGELLKKAYEAGQQSKDPVILEYIKHDNWKDIP